MRKFLVAILFLTCFVSGESFANNGPNLIGVAPASIAMGGTGVANFTGGLTALYKNPSTLSDSLVLDHTWNLELSVGMISENASASGGTAYTTKASTAPMRFIPDLALTYKLDSMFSFGFGVMGTAGSSVNYVNQAELSQLGSTFNLVRFVPAIAVQPVKGVSLGAGPIMNYGELSLNYQDGTGIASGRQPHGAVGWGFEVGAEYKPTDEVTLGGSFLSASQATYPTIAQFDLFGPNVFNPAGINDLTMTQPWELAFGVTAKLCSEMKVTVDYRHIAWDQVDPFRSLNWGGQDVFSVGGEIKLEKLSIRAGYSFSPAFVPTTSGEDGASVVSMQGRPVFTQNVSLLDATVFPAYNQHHITLGAGYPVLANLTIDASAFWAPTSTLTRSGTGATGATYKYTGNVSLWSATLGANYSF
jgi:long-chain fatty acid transport protein